ncbi:MAG TPA: hypothetical protein VLA96_11035 [Terriglobales bacterium]|nr:hypothetical protein [Terriglobales bacterium]
MKTDIQSMAIEMPPVVCPGGHPNRLPFRGVLTVSEVRRMRGLPETSG